MTRNPNVARIAPITAPMRPPIVGSCLRLNTALSDKGVSISRSRPRRVWLSAIRQPGWVLYNERRKFKMSCT